MHIITCLGGGLGNQLFQYAAGRALASRTGARLLLDDSRIRAPGGFGYVLGNLAIEEVLVFGRHCGPEAECYRTMAENELGFPFLREHSFDYDARFETFPAPAILFGFWQSEKYFRSIAESIRSEFRLSAAPTGANARWLDEIKGVEAVCVHVRRTDTVTTISAKTHGTCSVDYYKRAMEHLRRTVQHPRFFVFSDDWDWSRAHFAAPDTVVVDANGPEAADQELRLMSACRHHIIANSSLSWWAGWLGNHESQIVIAPEPWFVSGRPTPDLLPNRWLLLPRD
jgi:glycosyl transferase family 11